MRMRDQVPCIVGWIVLIGLASMGSSCSSDDVGPECAEGVHICSADGLEIRECQGGQWQITACMADHLQLCEDLACVDPWDYGSPDWSTCPSEPRATAESLRDKMEHYEDIARRLHVHPELKWMAGVILPCLPVDCPPGEPEPCVDCSQPAVPESEATWQDVETWQSGENDGLWSSLYLTSQAYRYAVTGDQDALDMVELLLEGEQTRMAITGVPGVYTRQFVPPDIPGLSCPSELEDYIPDEEKDDNQWVQIGADGCVQVVDPDSMQFESTDHCGLDEFAGWCWLDNVSKDEYSGHMLAHAAVAALVDDVEVQQLNADLLRQIGEHLIEHSLWVHDWDGRPTEHGMFWAGPAMSGFAAAQTWAFMKTIAVGTGDPQFQSWLDECLLRRVSAGQQCVDEVGAATDPYDQLIGFAGLYLGCSSNWNNYAMHMLSLHTLLMLERDPGLRSTIVAALTNDVFDPPDQDRPLIEQNNALYDFMFAADKQLGPESDGPAYEVVENGLCMMRQFPASTHMGEVSCPPDQCVQVCDNRLDHPMTDYPRPVAERCMGTFIWWGTPYSQRECTEDRRNIKPPADYLLPYWMGRYYGYIDESM